MKRSPIWRMSRRRWRNGSTNRITATTSCVCCSSAVIPTCPRPSRSRWHCASSPDFPSRRLPAPSWSAKLRWSSGSPAPRRGSPRPRSRSRLRAPIERAERLAAVAAMIYLVFNEGYSAGEWPGAGASLRRGDPACPPAAASVSGGTRDHGFGGADAAAARAQRRAVRHRRRDRAAGRPGSHALEQPDDRRRPGTGRQGGAAPATRFLSDPGRHSGIARAREKSRRTPTGRRSRHSMPRWSEYSPHP